VGKVHQGAGGGGQAVTNKWTSNPRRSNDGNPEKEALLRFDLEAGRIFSGEKGGGTQKVEADHWTKYEGRNPRW